MCLPSGVHSGFSEETCDVTRESTFDEISYAQMLDRVEAETGSDVAGCLKTIFQGETKMNQPDESANTNPRPGGREGAPPPPKPDGGRGGGTTPPQPQSSEADVSALRDDGPAPPPPVGPGT